MDLLLKDGDLVPGTDGLPVPVEGREELLQRALIRLCARRGGFAPYPGLGSRLYRAGAAGEAELRALCEEALAGLKGPDGRPLLGDFRVRLTPAPLVQAQRLPETALPRIDAVMTRCGLAPWEYREEAVISGLYDRNADR